MGLRSLVIAALGLLIGCGAAAAPESIEAFRDAFVARAKQEAPEATFRTVDGATVMIAKPGGREAPISVATAYQYYRNDPTRRDDLIERLVATLKEDHSAVLDDSKRLVVIVRSTNNRGPDNRPAGGLSRPLAGDLMQILAVDSPASLRYASPQDLEAVKLSQSQAWEVAMTNTLRLLGEVETGELAPSLLAVTAESGFATSLLASPETCGKQAGEGAVVLMVSRDMFVFAPAGKPAAQAAFWRFVRETAADEEAVSRTPLICRDGVWAAATAPSGA